MSDTILLVKEPQPPQAVVVAAGRQGPPGPTGGPAGGVLSGHYPDPGFAVDMTTQGELGTSLGSTVLVNSQPEIVYQTPWGVRVDGTVYYDPDGASPGEERILVVGLDGSLNLVVAGG